jgi:hypothetical protein
MTVGKRSMMEGDYNKVRSNLADETIVVRSSGGRCRMAKLLRFCHRTRGRRRMTNAPSDGGGGLIACVRNEVEECARTCGHQPTNGAKRPEEGRVRCEADGESSCLSRG